jgi:hypothetical protein
MTHTIAKLLIAITLLAGSSIAQLAPAINELEQVTQLPPEVPQRVGGIAFDGKRIWFALYAAKGMYATYDPDAKKWDTTQDEKLRASIAQVTGRFISPGGIAFVDGKMWLASAYGESFGSIDVKYPAIVVAYNRLQDPSLTGGQSYADLAYDGTNIWIVWHASYYKNDGTKTHLLLKIDKDTGDTLAEYPVRSRTNPGDGAEGLAWDGHSLWHAKGNFLTEYDRNGTTRRQFALDKVNRPSGLAWDGSSLWIAEFGGKLWRLPFKENENPKSEIRNPKSL